MEQEVMLLYRCDAWMSTGSMELIGVFDQSDDGDKALSETVRKELNEIADGNDFDPAKWNVRKCFGKWVQRDLDAAREQQIDEWQDYFFEYNQTPTLRTNLYMEAMPLNTAA